MFNQSLVEDVSVRDIELFMEVVKTQSISEAAREQYISQPCLSIRMKQVEDHFGITLFKRTNKGIVLTDEGLSLYAAVHHAYHQFRVSMFNIQNKIQGKGPYDLAIGGLHLKAIGDSLRIIQNQYQQRYPSKSFNMEYFHYMFLPTMLYCEEIDVALTLSFQLTKEHDLSYRPLYPVEFQLLLPAKWGITALSREACAFISNQPLFVEMHKGGSLMQEICNISGVNAKDITHAPSFLEMLDMIAKGKGYTLWEPCLPKVFLERKCINKVPLDARKEYPPIYVSVAWKKSRGDDPKIQNLVDSLCKMDLQNASGLEQDGENNYW